MQIAHESRKFLLNRIHLNCVENGCAIELSSFNYGIKYLNIKRNLRDKNNNKSNCPFRLFFFS